MPKANPTYSIPFTKNELTTLTHALDLLLQELENYDDLTEDPLTKQKYKTLTKLYLKLMPSTLSSFLTPNPNPTQ